MKNFRNPKFLVFGAFLLAGVVFVGQAIFSKNLVALSDVSGGGKTKGAYLLDINTGKVGAWIETGSFPTPRERFSMVFVNGYAYVLGGTIGWAFDGAVTSTVYYAQVDSESNFGNWIETESLPGEANYDAAAFTANGFIYVLGGETWVNHATSSVWYSRINPDRSLGPWMSSTPLPVPTEDHEVIYLNGYVYVIGGKNIQGDLRNQINVQTNKVLYARVNGDGTLGGWRETSSLPVPLSNHSSVYSNGYIYAMGGGNDAGFPVGTNFYAKVNSDGSLGQWISAAFLPIKSGLANFYAASLGNFIYIFGGASLGINALQDVWFTRVGSGGSLGLWNKTTALPTKVSNNAGFVANRKVSVLGGQLDFTGPKDVTSTIWSAPLDVNEIIEISPN
ncbi:MAG: hypothetical protein AAB738_00320 [Patescibacteria group bacterium]